MPTILDNLAEKRIDILINFIFLILGIVVGTVFKRSKLVINGGGSGGGPVGGYRESYIKVENPPVLLGIRIKQNVILGHQINGLLELGIKSDRAPASQCTASLYDSRGKKFIGALYWRERKHPEKILQSVTIKSGQSAELLLFTMEDGQNLEYSAYEPSSENDSTPRKASHIATFSESKEFTVIIKSYDMVKKKFKTSIDKRSTNSFYFEVKNVMGSDL